MLDASGDDERTSPLGPQGPTGGSGVSTFQLTLKDRTTEVVDGADAYQQEGQMTTFFRTGSERTVVDTWSVRVASFRTSELIAVLGVCWRSNDCTDGMSAAVSPLGVDDPPRPVLGARS